MATLQLKELLALKGRARDTLVDWAGYKAIDAAEVSLGAAHGKPREKLVDIDEMLKIAAKAAGSK